MYVSLVYLNFGVFVVKCRIFIVVETVGWIDCLCCC